MGRGFLSSQTLSRGKGREGWRSPLGRWRVNANLVRGWCPVEGERGIQRLYVSSDASVDSFYILCHVQYMKENSWRQ